MIAVLATSLMLISVETGHRFNASLFPASDSILARAESLIVSGSLVPARRLLEPLERRAPGDVRVLILLGRVHLAWPVIGRFKADTLFRRAASLEPGNPEPWYWQGHVGLALGGDDGESMARRSLLRVIAIDPAYRDARALWTRLYAGQSERRDAIAALRRHEGSYFADLWRAQLLVELGDHAQSLPLLAGLMTRNDADPVPRALQARALFELGRDADGWAAYQEALARVDADTTELLWRQLRGIASPAERKAWAATPPEQREAFLRLFWTRREPNLFTGVNERLGEHFRRVHDARRDFGLLHPNARYHRSRIYRSLMGGVNAVTSSEVADLVRRAQLDGCHVGGIDSLTRLQYVMGHARRTDTAQVQESANIEDGLDDRGRVWLRHGRPDMRVAFGLDGETWCYFRREGTYRVTFIRRTGPGGASGDVIFTPVLPGEAESASLLMASDRSTTDYRLDFVFWPALFQDEDGRTELLLFPDSAQAVLALVGLTGLEAARDQSDGHFLRVSADPGDYLLHVDARKDGKLGSYRGSISLPDFGASRLAVSGLLVASGDVAPTRDAMALAAPPGLRLPAGEPLRLYAELYHLAAEDRAVRYEARYRFERLDGGRDVRGRETMVRFQRESAAAPRVIESLVIDPGRLAAGRYRVRLEVVDHVRGTSSVGASMELRLH